MEFFDVVGSFGPWQRRVFIVFLYVNMLGIWQNMSITFLAPNVSFKCVQPQGSNHSDNQCEVIQNDSTTAPCTRWEYDTSETSRTIVSEVGKTVRERLQGEVAYKIAKQGYFDVEGFRKSNKE
ncbi:uncharacterized protein TNCV_1844541 [Trichonephila clavipes]|nr:uncharacterized protein TNCV_1844541 [Trichonephila clavipes]